jgi:hypothetical protein
LGVTTSARWLSQDRGREVIRVKFQTGAGYRFRSSENAIYGVVWSQHINLLPAARVELTFAECSWAKTAPVDDGTRDIVKDAFQIIFDKDGILAKLLEAVMPEGGYRRSNSH